MTSKTLLFAIAVSFVACTHAMVLLQTPFSSNFSLRELVERSKATSGLNCEKGAGGGGGASNSIFAGGKSTSHYSKFEELSCKCKDARDFDESVLMKALSQTIELDLKEDGAQIIEHRIENAGSFYYRYELKGLTGKITISGRRFADDYSLNATINENKDE